MTVIAAGINSVPITTNVQNHAWVMPSNPITKVASWLPEPGCAEDCPSASTSTMRIADLADSFPAAPVRATTTNWRVASLLESTDGGGLHPRCSVKEIPHITPRHLINPPAHSILPEDHDSEFDYREDGGKPSARTHRRHKFPFRQMSLHKTDPGKRRRQYAYMDQCRPRRQKAMRIAIGLYSTGLPQPAAAESHNPRLPVRLFPSAEFSSSLGRFSG